MANMIRPSNILYRIREIATLEKLGSESYVELYKQHVEGGAMIS